MDDIRPPRTGSGNYPNRSSQPNQIYNNSPAPQPTETNQFSESAHDHGGEDYHLPDNKKKSGKGKTFALVFFILLFLAAAGLAAYLYFIEMVKMQDDIDELKTSNNRLVQQVRSLEYDNRDLNQKLELEKQNNTQQQSSTQGSEQPVPAQ